jgi:hypothetical protein
MPWLRAVYRVDADDELQKMVHAKFIRDEGRDFWTWSAGNRMRVNIHEC